MKLNTSTIEGYDSMTPEQKVAALEGLTVPDPDYSGYIKKTVFDQTASELAELKKKHNATLSAEEQAKVARDQEISDMKTELETLKKEKTVSDHKAKYIALGYDEALATETATALAEGNMDKVFENNKKFLTSHDKATRDELLKGTPRPQAGDGSKPSDYSAKIAEAQKNGDMAAVAYYTRLSAENTQT